MRQTISEGDRTSEMGQEYCGLHWHQYNLPDGLDPPPERQVDQGPGQQQAARQLPADGPDIVNTLRYVQHEITKICQQTLIWSWGNPDLPKIDVRGKKKIPSESFQTSNMTLTIYSWSLRIEVLRCEVWTYWKNSSEGILASRAESVRFLHTSTVTSLWKTQSPSLDSGREGRGTKILGWREWLRMNVLIILKKSKMLKIILMKTLILFWLPKTWLYFAF